MKKVYTVVLNNDGAEVELVKGTFEDIKAYLVNNTWDLFNWILDEESERELPEFTDCGAVSSLESVLSEYDYSWWTVSIN